MAEDVDDLLAELAKLKRQIAAQREEDGRVLGALREQLEEVAEHVGARAPEFVLSPWWWPRMNRTEAKAAWEALVPWVDDVVIARYDTAPPAPPGKGEVERVSNLPVGVHIRQCWFAHPDVLDRMSALYWAWKGDYRRGASATAPLEFQETWVLKTFEQVRPKMLTCLGGCPNLDGRKANEVSWDHRTAWIQNDIAGRPENS